MIDRRERSDFLEAVEALRPGAIFNVEGGARLGNIVWLDKAQTKPTKTELDAEFQRKKAEPRITLEERVKVLEADKLSSVR